MDLPGCGQTVPDKLDGGGAKHPHGAGYALEKQQAGAGIFGGTASDGEAGRRAVSGYAGRRNSPARLRIKEPDITPPLWAAQCPALLFSFEDGPPVFCQSSVRRRREGVLWWLEEQ